MIIDLIKFHILSNNLNKDGLLFMLWMNGMIIDSTFLHFGFLPPAFFHVSFFNSCARVLILGGEFVLSIHIRLSARSLLLSKSGWKGRRLSHLHLSFGITLLFACLAINRVNDIDWSTLARKQATYLPTYRRSNKWNRRCCMESRL